MMDFSYPEGCVGYHSGWSDCEHVTSQLVLSKRIQVGLERFPVVSLKILDDIVDIPPYYVKVKEGCLTGLSSGAGSALVRHNGNVFKIKRAGYKDVGFVKDKVPDRTMEPRGDAFFDFNSYEHGGSLSEPDALQEINAEQYLRSKGFVVPQHAVGLYTYELPFGVRGVALISHIQSDLRVDEYVWMIISNQLKNLQEKDLVRVGTIGDRIQFQRADISKTYDLFLSEVEKEIYSVGHAIGSIYRHMHDEGIVRGLGNSWFGNEILLPDGRVGVGDLESTFLPNQVKDNKVRRVMQQSDINLAKTAIYSSMVVHENFFFEFMANTLIDGFEEGYKNPGSHCIDKCTLDTTLSEYEEKKAFRNE